MAVLKIKHKFFSRDNRVKGSTLIETLVATVLIVLVFILASMILNNLFSNTIKNNTKAIETYVTELQYLQQHQQIQLPYVGTFKDWNVTIEAYKENNQLLVEFEAKNLKMDKTISVIQNAEQ